MSRLSPLLAACILFAAVSARADFSDLGFRVDESSWTLFPGTSTKHPDRPDDALPDGLGALGGGHIRSVWLAAPTERYGHGVLGDATEAGALHVVLATGRRLRLTLDADSVFEDLTPRLFDLDGDGRDEIVVVRSYLDAGAALAVYEVRDGDLRLRAETPPIGISHRWLNPVVAGDFDGDGRPEIAYVETPHIGGILYIYALAGDELRQEGRMSGFSNHAMGSRELALSAIVDLDGDGADDILLPDAGRRGLRAVSFAGGRFETLGEKRHDAPIDGKIWVGVGEGTTAGGLPKMMISYRLRGGDWVTLRR